MIVVMIAAVVMTAVTVIVISGASTGFIAEFPVNIPNDCLHS
jgi:hypothetical protein